MPRRVEVNPYKLVGLCCGEQCRRSKTRVHTQQILYRVGDIYRYRCAICFRRETGHNP